MRCNPSDLIGKRVRLKRSAVRVMHYTARADVLYTVIAAGDSTVTLAMTQGEPITVHVSEVEGV
jgi:oxalate decarboxylase/phosphoglucose isomerase-like protein (cupin superfamily)